jgi:hypothetical protein
MLGNRWPRKPPVGYMIDDEHPLAQGLLFFAPLWEGSGPTVQDIVGGLTLTLGSGATWGSGLSRGLVLNTTASYAQALAPAYLQLANAPTTIAMGLRNLASGTAFLGGVTSNSTYVTPYYGYALERINPTEPSLLIGSSSGDANYSGGSIPIGTDAVLIGTRDPGTNLYVGGAQVATSGGYHISLYNGTPYVTIGPISAAAMNPGIICYWMAIWGRSLAASEAAALTINPWQIFEPIRTMSVACYSLVHVYSLTGPTSGFESVASSNFTVTPNLAANDTVTLSDGGGGGTFLPSNTLTFTTSSIAGQTFTYTPSGTGARPLTVTSGDSYSIPASPWSFTSKAPAVNYVLTIASPNSAFAGQPSADFTLTPDGSIGYVESVSLSDGAGGGTFRNSSGTAVTSLVFTDTSAAQVFTYTPATGGTKTITLVSSYGATITGSPDSTFQSTAIGFTLTGPATGVSLTASTNFTLTPAAPTNDTISLSDGGSGVFRNSGGTVVTSLAFTVDGGTAAETFTYTPAAPGPKTITATAATGGTVTGNNFAYAPIPVSGSLSFAAQCYLESASNTVLGSLATATLAYRVQFANEGGALAAAALITKAGLNLLAFVGESNLSEMKASLSLASSDVIAVASLFQIGTPNHVVISHQQGNQYIFINGIQAASSTYSVDTVGYSGPLAIGMQANVACGVQIGDVAIWNNYPAIQADAQNLYAGIYNPLTLVGNGGMGSLQQAATWIPLSGTTLSVPPSLGDIGLKDWGTAAGTSSDCTLTTLGGGQLGHAEYASALGFVPPVEVAAYVAKSGKVAIFFPVSTVATANGFYAPQNVTGVGTDPAITWNGQAISIGPVTWSKYNQSFPWVAYLLECGSVQSVAISNGGTGFTGTPTIGVSGGSGTDIVAPTFGTVTLATGITGYTLGGVGAYGQYVSQPKVTLSGGTYTTAPSATAAYASGTSVSVNPTAGGILGCGTGVTGAPTVTLSGGVGAGATATATLSGGGIASVAVVAVGSGYTTATATAYVIDTQGGTGSGATLSVSITSGVITGIGVTATGSGYTNPVVVIQPGTGTGAKYTVSLTGGVPASSLTKVSGGSGYGLGTTAIINDPTGSGAKLTVTVTTEGVASIACTGGTGYTSPTVIITDGAQAIVTANTPSQYIAAVAMATNGSGYASPPTISVTGGGGTGATLTPVMSGPSSGDPLAYTSSWGWLQAAIGSVPPSPLPGSESPASIVNYTGVLEGPASLLAGFPTARTFRVGANMGSNSNTDFNSVCTEFVNRIKTCSNWTSGNPTITYDGQPYSWESGSATLTCSIYALGEENPIDSQETPSLFGAYGSPLPWTLLYYDPYYYVEGQQSTVSLSFSVGNVQISGGTPTPQPFGRNGNGSYVQITYPVEYTQTAGAWVATVYFNYANPTTSWTISDLFAVSPGNTAFVDAYLANPGAASQLAADGNVVTWITTSETKNQVPAVMRFMDVNNGYGGSSNVVDPTDLTSADNFSWDMQSAWYLSTKPPNNPGGSNLDPNGNPIPCGTVTFGTYRQFNTNVAWTGEGVSPRGFTYGWVTTKIYTEQWGGYPSGSDSFGPYIVLPATDMGLSLRLASENAPVFVAIELLTANGEPHGYKTGQFLTSSSGNYLSPAVPVISSDGAHTYSESGIGGPYQVFVTGPDSLVIVPQLFNSVTGPANTIALVDTDAQTGCSPAFETTITPLSLTPFEFSAYMGTQVGTDIWISIPPCATAATSLAIAEKVATNLTPGLKVFVEYGNEPWNDLLQPNQWMIAMGGLIGSMPVGTPIGPYYTTTGVELSSIEAYTILASWHHSIWYDYFESIGRASDVVRTFGGQFTNPSATVGTIMQTVTTYGIPVDHVHVAPYPNGLRGGGSIDTPIVVACSPAGVAGSPGNWPVPAIVDLIRHATYYVPGYWADYAAHLEYTTAYGQPSLPLPAVTLSASSGGALPSGYYYLSCTFVDEEGRETTIGNSQSLQSFGSAADIYAVQLPAVPASISSGGTGAQVTATVSGGVVTGLTIVAGGTLYASAPTLTFTGVGTGASATAVLTDGVVTGYTALVGGTGYSTAPLVAVGGSINVYLGTANQLPSSQVLYATGIPSGTNFALASGTWANSSKSPPTTNGVPLFYPIPTLIAYECAVQQYLQATTPFQIQIARDIYYHPSAYDLNTAFFMMMQAGHPGVANSGLVLGCFFALADQWQTDGSQWCMGVSTSQSPGYGTGNLFTTAQGGLPGDNRAHDITNELPLLQAFQDWMDASAPPDVTATTPTSGAVSVTTNPVLTAAVVATFNEAIEPDSLVFTIAPTAGGSDVAGTVTLDDTDTIATFTATGAVTASTSYTASVQATSSLGQPMASAYTWAFTTAGSGSGIGVSVSFSGGFFS